MPPKKGGYYAVRSGRTPGIYTKWDDCKAQVDGFTGAKYQKFDTAEQAAAFIEGTTTPAAASSSSAQAGSSSAAETSTAGKSKKRGTSTMMGPADVSEWQVVYSDGACKGNGKPGSVAGIGVWWGHDDPRNIAERCPGDQTNNRAELIAILRLLEETPFSKKPLLIKTDSKYSIQCLRDWLPGWVRNGWKNSKSEPVKNAAIIRLISSHLNFRAWQGQKVELAYVKGHSGHEGNDGADYQANLGALQPELPERDWAAAERELLARMESGAPAADVEAKETIDVIPPEPVDSPAKKRARTMSPDRTSAAAAAASTSTGTARPQTPPKSPLRQSRRLADIQAGLSPSKVLATTGGSRAFGSAAAEIAAETSPSKTSRLAAIENALSPSKPKPASPKRQRLTSPAASTSASRTVPKEPAVSPQKPQQLVSSTANVSPPRASSKAPPGAGAPVSPGRALWVAPSLMPVRAEEVNADDYADFLLSDDDLTKDLES
ncbi:ribonuclease H-like domain-containing protein [Coprinopsis sp. MPI-PUGE-AT-0042]|nr:ribonuclease H-like domain-containing protein [Coprinopsis sp. MPI-PUGE-AT-0042]